MTENLSATYKARSSTGSRIEIKSADVSPEANRLIVSLLAQPEKCAHILAYAAGELAQGGFVSPELKEFPRG